jgi:hypothetical protein
VAAVGTAILVVNLALDFYPDVPVLPAWALFLAFMLGNSVRNPALTSLASRVPGASARARFQSTQSAVQHLASAAGALLSSRLLSVGPGDRLVGMDRVALWSAALALALPFLLWRVERHVVRREAAASAEIALPAVAGP